MTCKNLPARSGQQFSISHGDYKAVVTELGATLRKPTEARTLSSPSARMTW